jgi:hypothetical protein
MPKHLPLGFFLILLAVTILVSVAFAYSKTRTETTPTLGEEEQNEVITIPRVIPTPTKDLPN